MYQKNKNSLKDQEASPIILLFLQFDLAKIIIEK